jgi:hypothetical protein
MHVCADSLSHAKTDLSDHPAVIFFVGVVPLVIVTYLQATGSVGMGMQVKGKGAI